MNLIWVLSIIIIACQILRFSIHRLWRYKNPSCIHEPPVSRVLIHRLKLGLAFWSSPGMRFSYNGGTGSVNICRAEGRKQYQGRSSVQTAVQTQPQRTALQGSHQSAAKARSLVFPSVFASGCGPLQHQGRHWARWPRQSLLRFQILFKRMLEFNSTMSTTFICRIK